MNRARLYINIKLLLLAVLTLNLSGCELDERVDDLTRLATKALLLTG